MKKLEIFQDFIKWQREQEKDIKFAVNDDLSVLYRFINDIGGWSAIYKKK